MIELKDVSKVYSRGNGLDVVALADLSLKIAAGEFVAVQGASGSGKSTLMNILGFLDRPTGGSYFFEGEDVADLDDDTLSKLRNQKIGFVFQSFNLLPRATAEENVELPLLYSDRSQIKDLAARALVEVGLSDRKSHYPNELSGGEQQRVAIARALVNDPAVILADEPTGNLDSKSSGEIMALLQQLHDKGRTIILVTHDVQLAKNANRLIVIHDGRLEKKEKKSVEQTEKSQGGK